MSIPEPSDLSKRFPRAQVHFAAVVSAARFLDAFDRASPQFRACLLSQSQQGAMFAFTAVPSSHHAAMLPISFITAVQRRLRLPLNVLAGLHTCKCGAQVDPYGDHLLSCSDMLHIRTGAWHDSILDVVCKMYRVCNHNLSVDCRRPRAVSAVYSPLVCPDVTLLHAAPNGAHVVIDVTTTSVTKAGALPAASESAGATARGAAAEKLGKYGALGPHVLLPFVVEDAGALGKEAKDFLKKCKGVLRDTLPMVSESELNWSNRGFSNYFYQSLSLANVQGMGFFFTSAAAIVHSHAHA